MSIYDHVRLGDRTTQQKLVKCPKKVGPLIDVHPRAANISEVFTSRSTTSPTKNWLIKVVMSSIWSFSIHASSDANELLLKDQSNIQYSEEGSKYRLVRDAIKGNGLWILESNS